MRNLRRSAIFAIFALTAVSTFGQNSSQWRTAADISGGVRGTIVGTVANVDEANGQIQLDSDNPSGGRIFVTADAVTTQYNGFGTVINGQPEIFTGSPGFANIRVGDRLQVRGTGSENGRVSASYVTLLGRPVPAPQTGVGTTRPPSSISTPTASTTDDQSRASGRSKAPSSRSTPAKAASSSSRIGGKSFPSRHPLERRCTTRTTPIAWRTSRRGTESESFPTAPHRRAVRCARGRSKSRTASRRAAPPPAGTTVTGRVSAVDRTVDMVTVDTGRQPIRVDVATANDNTGHRVRALDFQAGDQVSITGHYGASVRSFRRGCGPLE